MTDQTTAAAERSAHVERGGAKTNTVCPLVEVSPGVWRLRVVVELAAALEAASAALDEAVDCLATEWLDDRGTVPRLRAAADAAHAAVVRFSTNPKEV